MTKTPNTSDAATTAAPFKNGLEGMTAFNPMRETAMQAWLDIGAEALKFASDRMTQDMQVQKELLECKGLEDLQKIQTAFFSKAVADYTAEMSRTMELMMTASTGSMLPTRRAYDDVPL